MTTQGYAPPPQQQPQQPGGGVAPPGAPGAQHMSVMPGAGGSGGMPVASMGAPQPGGGAMQMQGQYCAVMYQYRISAELLHCSLAL